VGRGRSSPRLLVAAGGTGGHLYPALAVARKLIELEPEAEVIFSGTRRGLEGRIVPRAGFPLEMVRVEPLRGGTVLRKLKGVVTLPLAVLDAVRLLLKVRPNIVMGVGGYVSGPVLAVAGLSRVPTLILEPNVIPGLANRWLSPFVDVVAVAWEETKLYFGSKSFLSGNPVREALTQVPPRAVDANLRLLIFGGSQGSRVLNEAMVAALPHFRTVKDRLEVTHQTGEAELEYVRAAYRQNDIPARVEPYLEAMEKEYADCDLVICRAGATTCAELAATGRASLLVPLALAGGHQRDNAQMMVRKGAARILEEETLTGEALARTILELLDEPGERRSMAERALSLARPDAAGTVAKRMLELAGYREGSRQ
jgi:UDP-N-acetylglucosamine--N-acetylmuramyl-(pentapeptide) pyrophosphoryl-undecaprenol N-acetylglucosamine transferase